MREAVRLTALLPKDSERELFDSIPEVMDSKTAAAALSVPERTIRELARNNEVRGFKIGTNWRFTRQSLVEYVIQQEQHAGYERSSI